ncbi:MAG: hypothetical protein P4L84_21655 [Isosphaeraceae bacterium]|nr:hypothetical protein [Isosphaeraceae bacterium]
MCNQPFRMVVLSLSFVLAGSVPVRAQDNPAPAVKPEEAAEPAREGGKLPGPPEIPPATLASTLKTVPVAHGKPAFNVRMVDAALLPRDKEGIWVLDFAFKPVRLITVEVPGKGRKLVHYLYYKVVNRTGKPRMFVPQFTLVTDTGRRIEEAVLPRAVELVRAREDPSIPLLGAVDVVGMIPPSTKQGVDDAVYGVAIWEGVDPKADAFHIYVRGLSDGYQELPSPDGSKSVTRYKTLRIDFLRRGDERNLNEKEIQLNEPPYEWVYW